MSYHENNIHRHAHMHDHGAHEGVLEHHHTVKEELLCHFPYAIFSVVISMICVALLSTFALLPKQFGQLFHLFHYLHLVFAATGVIITFRRFSKNVPAALVAGCVIPAFFCTLSDMIIPYIGGKYLELSITLHWCFISHFSTVVPFLVAGIVNGFVMSVHKASSQVMYSTSSHFFHIFVSSMASILYLFSFGFTSWSHHLSFLFMLLIIAVLLPCTLADIVVPMLFARVGSQNQSGKKQVSEAVKSGCCRTKSAENKNVNE